MKRKQWIILVILALIVPIILNIIIDSTNPLDSIRVVGTEVNWLGFYGSYIGALIGALITLYAMFRESKNNALNIMINNQENLIKDLREQLSARISTLTFSKIGNFALYTTKENLPVDKSQIDSALKELNDYHTKATQEYNAWGTMYADDTRKIVKQFNGAYLECITQYHTDINTITRKLYDLKNLDSHEDFKNFNEWLKVFCVDLSEHQQKFVKELFRIARIWLQSEKDKFENLQKQLQSSGIRINNDHSE